MADRLAEDGYRDAGYKYVSIDVSSVFSHVVVVGLSNLILKLLNSHAACTNFRIAGPIRKETLLVTFNPTVQDFQVE